MNYLAEKILIIARPGGGKTYSLRNLDPATTFLINQEYKTLPFEDRFGKNHYLPRDWRETWDLLITLSENPVLKLGVLDSFSGYMDSVLAEARKIKKGWDVWTFYNEQISRILELIKRYPKALIITTHYEWLQDEGGVRERRAKVKGREWEGLIEKEFSAVFFGEVRVDVLTKKREWYFSLHNDGANSAKCPPRIFPPEIETIPNDCNQIPGLYGEMTTSK